MSHYEPIKGRSSTMEIVTAVSKLSLQLVQCILSPYVIPLTPKYIWGILTYGTSRNAQKVWARLDTAWAQLNCVGTIGYCEGYWVVLDVPSVQYRVFKCVARYNIEGWK
jgi:hypothetical protein